MLTLSASALLEGSWSKTAAAAEEDGASASTSAGAALALVMPGGADLPLLRRPRRRGNELIRTSSKSGRVYSGVLRWRILRLLPSRVRDRKRRLSVEGDRELGFFPGVALGAVVPGFRYETEAGAAATKLRWRESRRSKKEGGGEEREERWRECLDYCNGGPVFVLRGGGGREAAEGRKSGRVPDKCEVGGVAVEVLARYHEKTFDS